MRATIMGLITGLTRAPTMRQLARRRGLHQPVSSGIIILARAYYAARDRKRAPVARIETKLHRNLSFIVRHSSNKVFLDRSETI